MHSSSETRAPPFVCFFLLASLDAIASMGVLLVSLAAGVDLANAGELTLFAWHGRELVFGYAPGVCAGFLLTALPRWTGRTPSRESELILLALWLVARFAILLPAAFAPLVAAPLIALAWVVSIHVVSARDWRDLKVIALLWLSALGGLLVAIPRADAFSGLGLRIGIAASMGLVMTVGGRVASSVTASLIELQRKPPVRVSHRLEMMAACSAAAALIVWVIHPAGLPMALAGLLGAAAHFARLAQWRGWAVASTPPVFMLHVAYGFVPLGFALFAANGLWPDRVPESAALHAWMVGGLGLMTLAVMGSMIRKRMGKSFVTSRTAVAVFALAGLSAAARIAAALSGAPMHGLMLAAGAWIAAFALFVIDFRTPLLTRPKPGGHSKPPEGLPFG